LKRAQKSSVRDLALLIVSSSERLQRSSAFWP
jgi:hypothetical protein